MKSYTRHLVALLALAVVVVVALAPAAASQDQLKNSKPVPLPQFTMAPGIAPLTPDEERDIRTLQLDVRDATAAYTALVEDTNKRLLQTQEFYRQQGALAALRAEIDKVFAARRLAQEKDASLCDGPDQRPACADMLGRRLEIRPVPVPAPKAK